MKKQTDRVPSVVAVTAHSLHKSATACKWKRAKKVDRIENRQRLWRQVSGIVATLMQLNGRRVTRKRTRKCTSGQEVHTGGGVVKLETEEKESAITGLGRAHCDTSTKTSKECKLGGQGRSGGCRKIIMREAQKPTAREQQQQKRENAQIEEKKQTIIIKRFIQNSE